MTTRQRNHDYSAGEHPGSLAALDFDDDGNVDVAIANHEADSITLLRGRGGAKFDAVEQSSVPIATQPHSHVIRTADLDGDGILDLVVDSRDRFGIYVLRGNASGGFEAPGQGVDVGGSPYLGFVVSDLNGDGKPDIATPNQDDVSVMLNRSSQEIAFERISSIPFPIPFAVGAADLNGDESIDLVVAGGEQAHGVATFSGDGDGHFEEATFTPMARGAKLLATGNVTGDEFSDAVITSWNSEIVLLIGGATGASPVRLAPSGIRNPWGLVIADFNKDGRGEVVVGDASSSRVHIYSLLPSQD